MTNPGFSGVLRISDLDDFITPSQECIKPIMIEKTTTQKRGRITVESDGSYVEVDQHGSIRKLKQAKITLADCLACSGCITSAESILIQQQSHEEFLNILRENEAHKLNNCQSKIVIVSISPQSTASIAAKFDWSLQETFASIAAVLTKLGVDHIIDTTFARNFSLQAMQHEFVERFRASSTACSTGNLPMLAGICPGWVCYAEKSHGDLLIPYMSRTRSPQAVIGIFVKSYLAEKLGVKADDIYHCCVMPCFDKKLEASRADFLVEGTENVREVDCVISTSELDLILEHHRADFTVAREHVMSANGDSWLNNLSSPLSFMSSNKRLKHTGGGSGGYADHVFRYAAKELFGQDIEILNYRTVRNKDFREVTLERDGKVLLSFATAYGFRNIQSLVQKLKRTRSSVGYHFVEVMACPSGCLNGGGQIKPADVAERDEFLQKATDLYESAEEAVLPENCAYVQDIVKEWLGGWTTEKAHRMLYTSYHAIEKNTLSMNIKW